MSSMEVGELDTSAYMRWQRGEGIPVYKGFTVPNLRSIEVQPWARTGGKGCFINLAEQEDDDGQMMEIAPGGSLNPERHLYEELIYVVSGRGATTIWQPGKPKQTVEWSRGSVFSPPLNSHHQHFNADGLNPARLLCVTAAPMVINLFHNYQFVFNNDFVFADRYDAQDDYFSSPGQALARGGRIWKTNFVPDARTFKLVEWKERGAGGTNVTFAMSNNSMCAHISEFPVGTYKKAHRHGPGAYVVIIAGKGYSLIWPEGAPRTRVDWEEGSLFVPPDQWYHQHFNTGTTPARYLALRFNSPEFTMEGPWQQKAGNWGQEAEAAGFQIEYAYEDPEIRALYEAECAKVGATVVLPRTEYRQKEKHCCR